MRRMDDRKHSDWKGDIEMIEIPLFSLLYALKGGTHAKWRNRLKSHDQSIPEATIWFLTDGKVLSTLGVFFYGLISTSTLVTLNPPVYEGDVLYALSLAFFWLLAVSPSIGEEISAVGGYKGAWGPYLEKFTRSYGVKKAIQRGVFMGAMLVLATGNIWMIALGSLMPVCYYAGTSLMQKKTRLVNAPWNYGEWIFGALIGTGV